MNGTQPLAIKVHSLTGRITIELMRRAFLNVKKNRGAAGIDRQSIQMFERQLEQNLVALMRVLKDRSFEPLPSRREHIDKGGGKTRPLGIPCVRDRVAQEVLRQLLSPVFEKLFHDQSHGFRPARSCHDALKVVDEPHKAGYRFVLDADIKGFPYAPEAVRCRSSTRSSERQLEQTALGGFDNIPHVVIMTGLRNVIADGNILTLIERFLAAGVMEDGVFYPTTVGTPQG